MATHLVTGNAGFIGSWLADALLEQGRTVCGIDNLSGGRRENVHRNVFPFWEVDIADGPPLADLGCNVLRNVDVLWHLAADATEGRSQFTPTSALHNNAVAYQALLVDAIKAWKEAGDIERRKVILFSSIAVYGEQALPFKEDAPRQPVDVYGASKTYMETITEVLAKVHNFRYTIIRPHNVYGPRQRLGDRYRNVVGIFMNKIMRGEPLTIYGDGTQRRAFSYIEDSLPAMLACVAPKTDGRIFNIGGRRGTPVNLLAEIVQEALDVRAEVVHVADRPCEVKHAIPAFVDSVRELGYEEAFTLQEGVAKMAKWAVKQGPQPWSYTKLELDSEKAPAAWRSKK